MGIRHFAAGAAACAVIAASSCAAFAAAGSFTDLQKMIDGAAKGTTITLDKDYTYQDSDEAVVSKDRGGVLSFNEGVLISKDITIDGAGHTISGAGKMRVFRIGKSDDLDQANRYKVTLKNMKITDGNAVPAGSAIYVGLSHDVTILNVEIKNNKMQLISHDRDGGAIMIDSMSNVTIENSIIADNTCERSKLAPEKETMRSGGIITRGDLVVKSCEISRNKGSSRGGGIYVDPGYKKDMKGGAYGGNVKVYDSRIVENSEVHRGGGIYMNPINKKENIIENTVIMSNDITKAGPGNGGGIVLYDGVATVRNCKIIGNKALRGGGILVDVDAEMRIEGCEITDNKVISADGRGNVAAIDQNIGGGIACYDGSNASQKMSPNVAKLTIKNTKVTGNTNKDGAPDDVIIHWFDVNKFGTDNLAEGRINRYDGFITSEGGNTIGTLTNPKNFEVGPNDVIGNMAAIDAPDAEWKPSTGNLVIVLSVEFDQFEGVFIDSVELTRDVDYKAERGSTKITLYGDKYLSSLSKGQHIVDIMFQGGVKRRVTLDVTEAAGRSSSSGCAMGAFGVAAAAFAALKLRRKK